MKPWSVLTALAALSLLSNQAGAGTQIKFLTSTVDTAQWQRPTRLHFGAGFATSREFLVQFKTKITELDKENLAQHGVEVLRYVPDDALIVRGTLAQAQHVLAEMQNLQAVIDFEAQYKISPQLTSLSVFANDSSVPLKITLFKEADARALAFDLDQAAGVVSVQRQGRWIYAQMNPETLRQIISRPGIEFVENIVPVVTLDMKLETIPQVPIEAAPAPKVPGDYKDLNGYESGGKVLHILSAWAKGFFGKGQILAMADTGLDSGNPTSVAPDFQDAVSAGFTDGIGADDWSDPMGHGTHVAGSILGRGVTSSGKIKGGAYEAGLVIEGMWSPIVNNLTVPPQLATLFDQAYTAGARVHSNSWGSANFGAYDSMASQVDEYIWNHQDFLVLFAAGNSGVDHDKDGRIDPNSIGSPGTAKNCLTVGASKNLVSNGGIQKKISQLKAAAADWSAEPIFSSSLSENENGIAMFSSRGPTSDNRIKPDVVAPGTNILSNRSHIKGAEVLWGIYNDDYVWSGGTSMSTPVSAGFAGLTREILEKNWNLKDPSAAMVKAVMMHSAFDMYPGQFGIRAQGQELLTVRPNNDEGYGRLDMNKLLSLSSGSTNLLDDKEGVAQGETRHASVSLQVGQKLTVNLVYTDAPGTPAAAQALVNDLDLVIVTPSGKEIASHDQINNSEVQDLTATEAGMYAINVRGVNVPMGQNGKQPFALVFTHY